ncbi:hypothetical protein GEMRC1_011337 [Eukaryota sp. GEM-RC1]
MLIVFGPGDWVHRQVSFNIDADPSILYSVDYENLILYRSGRFPDEHGDYRSAEQIFKLQDGYVFTKCLEDLHCHRQDIGDQEQSILDFIHLTLPPRDATKVLEKRSGKTMCTVVEAKIPYNGPEVDFVHVEYCVTGLLNYETRITDPKLHDLLFDVRYFSEHQKLEVSDRMFNEDLLCSRIETYQ